MMMIDCEILKRDQSGDGHLLAIYWRKAN